MKVFDNTIQIPTYLKKHQKAHEISLILSVFVLVPILSVVIATRGDMRAVNKSLSWLAYRENNLALVYFWGIANITAFFYALRLTVDAGCYTKRWRKFLFSLAIISCVILTIGISVPYLDGERDEVYKYFVMRKIHNTMSTIGLVMFFITLIAVLLSTYFRNKRQFALSMGMLGFIFISSITAITQANVVPGPCFVSSVAQIYMFSVFSVALAIEYFLMREMDPSCLDNTREQPQEG